MTDQRALSKLEGNGLKVHKFTAFHYRIADRFDVYLNDRGCKWKYHDLPTGIRDEIWPHKLAAFVPAFLKENPVEEAVRSLPPHAPKGVWSCGMPGCTFEMADDGTAESARKQLDHLETHEHAENHD
ncbi:MAG TPA: hypothetical protein VN976_22120 [Verrucomicrobiae bacterium]|nr:hypothetical protein [Verrucomicrobiae bacterium]